MNLNMDFVSSCLLARESVPARAIYCVDVFVHGNVARAVTLYRGNDVLTPFCLEKTSVI